MAKPLIYLDHAATTATRPEVVEAMLPYLGGIYGNPASLHAVGREAGKALAQAKWQIAALLEIDSPEDIIMTSGATESNNLALKGLAFSLQNKGRHIITSQIEHPAVLEPCAWLASQGWQVTYLPVDEAGCLSPTDLEESIQPDTVLISLIHGNNEVGTLQPLAKLGAVARKHKVLFHTDAVQTLGKLPLSLKNLPVDLLSCSAHKFYGPKGVGFLYANSDARTVLTPLLQGGGQQGNLRSGTESVAAVVGLAKALELADARFEQELALLHRLQEKLIAGIQQIAPAAMLNGPCNVQDRVPGNVSFSFAPVEGEALVLRFDLEGICLSSGSACHSGQLQGSHVLRAMRRSEAESKSSVRFSLGHENTEADVERVLEVLPVILNKAGYFRSHPIAATIG